MAGSANRGKKSKMLRVQLQLLQVQEGISITVVYIQDTCGCATTNVAA